MLLCLLLLLVPRRFFLSVLTSISPPPPPPPTLRNTPTSPTPRHFAKESTRRGGGETRGRMYEGRRKCKRVEERNKVDGGLKRQKREEGEAVKENKTR